MKLPIKLLVFASASLFSYSAAASLLEISSNPQPKSEQLITGLNAATYRKASNFYVANNLSESGTVVLPYSEQTDWSYNMLTQLYGGYNPDNYNNFWSGMQAVDHWLKDDLVMLDLSVKQKVSAFIHDTPLPAAVWLFLGGLLGLLRIQRRPVDG